MNNAQHMNTFWRHTNLEYRAGITFPCAKQLTTAVLLHLSRLVLISDFIV